MQAEVPLKTSYSKEKGYDATATSMPLLVTAGKEMEADDNSEETPPDNHRTRSLVALCCFCPVGVKALSQSLIVDRLLKAGDTEGAKHASKRADHYAMVAVRIAVVLYGILIVIFACLVIFAILYGVGYALYQ